MRVYSRIVEKMSNGEIANRLTASSLIAPKRQPGGGRQKAKSIVSGGNCTRARIQPCINLADGC